MRKTILIYLLFGTLAVGFLYCNTVFSWKSAVANETLDNGNQLDKTAGPIELKLSVKTKDKDRPPRLILEFHNNSENDINLNLGYSLANAKHHLPSRVQLNVTAQGKETKLRFTDPNFPGIGGRVDDYIAPLRAGSIYSLTLLAKNFVSPDDWNFKLDLADKNLRIFAEITGAQPEFLNGDTQGLKFVKCWDGHARSNEWQLGQ